MNSSALFNISTFAYIVAMVLYIGYLVFRNGGLGLSATSATILGFAAQTTAILVRWSESYTQWIRFSPDTSTLLAISRSAPLRNLYESIVFFIWSMICIYIVIEFAYKNRSLGAFVTPIAGLALAFVEMSGMDKTIQPLVPALQSNWLIAHVLISFFGYGAFAVSYATANMHMIMETEDRKSSAHIFWAVTFAAFLWSLLIMLTKMSLYPAVLDADGHMHPQQPPASFWIGGAVVYAVLAAFIWRFGLALRQPLRFFSLSINMLDDITYKSIAVGFPLLSLGIITGAIWADSAWGTYWSWDPKETWSLITWFVYALYLHSRLMRGWKGRKTAIIAIVGFISVIFTYLGVNLLLSGLHSYGGG